MKREFSHNLTNHMAKKTGETVVVVRSDGKEFLIKREVLAEHINRGFTVKDKKDQPSEEELSKAVGYRDPARAQGEKAKADAAEKGDDTGQEPEGPADTVPEEEPKKA